MARPKDPTAKLDLLRVAAQVFVEKGLEEARVEDITTRAGRSKGSFYLHFASKEDAFTQIVEDMTTRLEAALAAAPAAEVRNPQELLQRMQDALRHDVEVFEFLWTNRELARLMLSGAGSARFKHLIDRFAETAAEQTRAWIRWGQAQGLYREDLNVEVVSQAVAGAYDRVARHLVTRQQRPDIPAWLGEVQRLVSVGIGTPWMAQLTPALVATEKPRKPRARHRPVVSVEVGASRRGFSPATAAARRAGPPAPTPGGSDV